MANFFSIIHIITALLLIVLVLIQDSKGGGALGIGGSSGSNSLLGATGAQTLAAKLTRIAAIVFALTSISLSVISGKTSKSVLDGAVLPTPPAATATTTAPTEGAAAAAGTTETAPAAAQPAETAPATTK